MKKFKLASTLLVLALTFTMLTACKADPIAEDLKAYTNTQLPAVQELETKAITAYNAVSATNYTDDATMLAALNDTVVPASSDALAAAQKIAPATPEVTAIRDQYVAALTDYNNGYLALVEALNNGDTAKTDEAKAFFATAESKKTEYMNALVALGKDHGLAIKTK